VIYFIFQFYSLLPSKHKSGNLFCRYQIFSLYVIFSTLKLKFLHVDIFFLNHFLTAAIRGPTMHSACNYSCSCNICRFPKETVGNPAWHLMTILVLTIIIKFV